VIDDRWTAVPNGNTLRLHRMDVALRQRYRFPRVAPFSIVERAVNFLKQRIW
jgi:hypothetical protein